MTRSPFTLKGSLPTPPTRRFGRSMVLTLGLLGVLACSKDTKQAPTAEPPNEAPASAQNAKDTPASAETKEEQPSGTENKPTDEGSYGLDSHEPTPARTGAPAANAGSDTNGEAETDTAAKGTGANAEKAQPKADAPTETTPTIRGAAVSGEGFRAHLQSASKLQKGKPGSIQLVLEAVAPFHCNDKYPYKFTPSPTPGVSYPGAVIKNMTVGEQRSTMNIPFTAGDAGEKQLSGEFAFSVCTDDKCLIEKQKLSITVNVADAS